MQIARAVFGVALALTLAGAANATQRPDAWVTTKVKMSLLTSEGVSTRNLQVDTIDGRVSLPAPSRRRPRRREPKRWRARSTASSRFETCCRSSRRGGKRSWSGATRS